jgi:hypothetical protein
MSGTERVKITEDVRKNAGEQGIADEEALVKGWARSPESSQRRALSFTRKANRLVFGLGLLLPQI